MSLSMLRRFSGWTASSATRRSLRRSSASSPSWPSTNGRRGLLCNAAVNAHNNTQTAVDDCLERVFNPDAKAPVDFAVVFFEGHDSAGVQEALHAYAEREPQAPPVIGCSIGVGGQQQRWHRLRAKSLPASSSSSSSSSIPLPDSFRSPTIVTVLGLGFGGRVEAIPVSAEGGSFPSIAGDDSIPRIFALPREKQPLFLLMSRHISPPSDLEESFERLVNLLPGSTRLSAISSGEPSTIVSSFPTDHAPVVGVCLLGEISLEEQAELARKTLGAFGLDEVSASGSVCDELFVPSAPAPPVLLPHHSSGGTVSADSLSREREEAGGSTSESDTGVAADAEGEASLGIPSAATAAATADGDKDDDSRRGLEGGPTSSRRAEEHESAMPSSEGVQKIVGQQRQGAEQRQMSVFKVEDFVFPGMTRRFRIFEPRYRALVKRCLSEGEPLVILPLSKGGNTVGTAAYVSGLHNVEEDGRCEIEITGIARCNVVNMWLKGESFGLYEAVVEYFGDEKKKSTNPREGLQDSPGGTRTASGSYGSSVGADDVVDAEKETDAAIEGSGSTAGDEDGKSAGDDIELVSDLPELERLRIQVSAVLQRELFRTRKVGRSPLWPGWNGQAEDASVDPVFNASGESGDGDDKNGNGNGIGGLDPCDLDAEALSYWAAQNVEADVLTKHRWLSCTTTEDRLREIHEVCVVTMARHRDRSAVDGSVLSRPLSALHDLLSK